MTPSTTVFPQVPYTSQDFPRSRNIAEIADNMCEYVLSPTVRNSPRKITMPIIKFISLALPISHLMAMGYIG